MGDVTPDARTIERAINSGWIGRGFLLGIGFWLSGVAILAATLFALIALGLMAGAPAWLSRAAPKISPTTTASLPASPPDARSWQEQLRAADAAHREAQRRLHGEPRSP